MVPIFKNGKILLKYKGFTFVGLLIAIALSGIALAGIGQVWQKTVQREQEQELLFIGNAYRSAINHYYNAIPEKKEYPTQLEQLLIDKRFPKKVRHIRKLYHDPMNIHKEWGLIKQNNQIIGIYSQSTKIPLKRTLFPQNFQTFENANTYQEWRFVASDINLTPQTLNSKTVKSKTP